MSESMRPDDPYRRDEPDRPEDSYRPEEAYPIDDAYRPEDSYRPDDYESHADVEYRRRRQASRRGPSGPVLVLGALLLALVGVGIGLVAAGLLDEGPSAISPSAGASAASGATDAASVPPDEPAASQRTTPSALAPGAVVSAVADGIAIRQEATVSASLVGRLANGSRSYVVDGPVSADGFEWFHLTGMGIPPQAGCAGPIVTDPYTCPIWFGWAAAGSPEGEAWLEPVAMQCPEPGPVDQRWVDAQMEPMSLLACFPSGQVTVIGWLPAVPQDAGLGGACPEYHPDSVWLCDLGYQVLLPVEGGFFDAGLSVAVPPDGTDEFEALRGQWLEVTGHFDDPASDGCPDGHARQRCRARFVVESAIPTEAP